MEKYSHLDAAGFKGATLRAPIASPPEFHIGQCRDDSGCPVRHRHG